MTTRIVAIRTDERRLTPMTAYDHAEHIRAIAGDGLISESIEQRRQRQKAARQRLLIWLFLIIPGCLAGWAVIVWSALYLIEQVRR